MFYVGMEVKIKPEAWKRFLIEANKDINTSLPPPQIIVDMPNHPPFDDKFLLSFPLYWYGENDLEMV